MEENKQIQIYNFLKEYTEEKGYPPTIREICHAVSLQSTSTVHGHLERLEKKGFIKRNPLKPRAMEITELSVPKQEMIKIPIIKQYKGRKNLFDKENIEDEFQLPINFIKHDKLLFMINVNDDSMVKAGINIKDLAIIENNNSVKNNDIVLTVVNNEFTIKRYFKEGEHIRLCAENDYINDLILKECTIVGKLVGIFRAY